MESTEPTEAGDFVRWDKSEKQFLMVEPQGIDQLRERYLKCGILYDPVHYLDRYVQVSPSSQKYPIHGFFFFMLKRCQNFPRIFFSLFSNLWRSECSFIAKATLNTIPTSFPDFDVNRMKFWVCERVFTLFFPFWRFSGGPGVDKVGQAGGNMEGSKNPKWIQRWGQGDRRHYRRDFRGTFFNHYLFG